jgi:DNA-directed RNA polymerase specialized sigma24 family protein
MKPLDSAFDPSVYVQLALRFRCWGVDIFDLAQDLAVYCLRNKTSPTSVLAHSLAVDQVRARARYNRLLLSAPPSPETMTPETSTDEKDQLSSILAHTRLSSDELQVLHLHVCLGMTYDQIGSELVKTRNQVKHLHQHAIEKLRKTTHDS